jgi:ribosomal protein S12 methylthiotransferase
VKVGHAPAIVTRSAPLLEVNVRPSYIPDYATPRFRLTPRHFAYLKIAEGCNHPCSFCIIPRMRGGHRSRTQADIVQEARQLIAEGVRELNLISRTTYYGLDLRGATRRAIAGEIPGRAKSLPANAELPCCELNALLAFWIGFTHPAWTDS